MPNKENSGALFKEEKKTEKHPDYKGSCLIKGEVMYIAAWINTSEAGKQYMSLSFTPQSEQVKYSKENSTATPGVEFSKPSGTALPKESDDLPF